MKRYKPTYCISLLYYEAMILVCTTPFLLLADGAVAAEGNAKPGQLFGESMLVLGFFVAASILFIWLISFLAGLFTSKPVALSEDAVSYDGKTIRLDSIRYVTLYLPEIRRSSSKPQTLTLWADNHHYMDIKRPSIALIRTLKKRCVFAVFDVDDWKGKLKVALWIEAGITVLVLVAFLFSSKG